MNIKNSAALLARREFLRRLLFVVGWREKKEKTHAELNMLRVRPKAIVLCVGVAAKNASARTHFVSESLLVERKLCDVEIGFATTL